MASDLNRGTGTARSLSLRAGVSLEGLGMIKHMRGITLVELMIVILVLSIIIVVGYPNYREFAARAKRNEARAALLQIATNQERHYLNNSTYTADLTDLGFATTPTFTTETGSYRIQVPTANASTYIATATYLLGGEESNKCNVFRIDATGTKSALDGGGSATDCWTRTR